jgi:membrane dipeptidase
MPISPPTATPPTQHAPIPDYHWANEFVAKTHVVDGNVNWWVRVDPDCVVDCERAIFPGDGSSNFGTVKAATGLDMGLITISSGLSTMAALRDLVSSGRIANGRVIRTYMDIETAYENDQYAVMFYVQARNAPNWQLEGDIKRIRKWYDAGLRVLQLAYSFNDHGPEERLGYGDREGEELGLTPLGRAAIAEMNSLGIVVDVSHCSKQTTLDAAILSRKPIIATHANAKALTPESRNKDDEELLAIAATRGVIGVTTIRWMLDTDGNGAAGLHDMIVHIEYLVELVGIDHVGVATDAYMDGWPTDSGHYADVDLAASDRWVRLAARLHAKGWTEEELKKLLGGNFRRVFAENIAPG